MKSQFMQLLSWAVIFCMSGTMPAMAEKKACSHQEVEQAETTTDSLKPWNSVYRFHKQFSQCDDGSIAEGVSDAFAKLLANRWGSLNEFVKLASSDKEFENFVLRHVDETID